MKPRKFKQRDKTVARRGANSYQVGDLVLRKLEKMVNKATKLTPNYLGPYLVVAVDKADVTCRHLVTDVVSVFHMTELKMCFASRGEAYEAALVDFHQYVIDRILKYKGDPELRTSMTFLVRFADGSEVWLPFSRDLSESAQFEDFVRAHRPLMPLLYTVEAWKRIRRETFREVEGVEVGDTCYVDLRAWGSGFFESLNLPDEGKIYVGMSLCAYGGKEEI
jgi:hypothetical protein